MAYTQTIPYNGMPITECALRARNAIARLGWGNPIENPGHFFISIPISFCSWGESFTIRFYQDHMVIESRNVMPIQLDLGKNKTNVERFLREFYS